MASPADRQACPNVAACWSPRTPAIGTPASTAGSRTSLYTSDDEWMGANMDIGMPISSAISLSQRSACRSISRVREALVTSVMCSPPVMFHSNQVSMVPKHSSPLRARWRAPST